MDPDSNPSLDTTLVTPAQLEARRELARTMNEIKRVYQSNMTQEIIGPLGLALTDEEAGLLRIFLWVGEELCLNLEREIV